MKYYIYNNRTYDVWTADTFAKAYDIARKSAMSTGGSVDIDPPYPVERERIRLHQNGDYTIRRD